MIVYGCDIGFIDVGEGDEINVSSKYENITNVFIGPTPINSMFNCTFISEAKLDISEFGCGTLRLTLYEGTDEMSHRLEEQLIGEWAIAIFSQADIIKLGKMLRQRLMDQNASQDVLMYYKTSKSINGNMKHVQLILDKIN